MKHVFCPLLCLVLVAGWLGVAAAHPPRYMVARMVDRTFPVQPGGILRLESGGGTIHVQATADRVMTVHAQERIYSDNKADADEVLKGLTLNFAQQGNDITVRAKYEGARPMFHTGSWPPVLVDFVVNVPASFSVNLDSGGGRTTVGDLAGLVHAHTGGGELNLGRIGGGIEASTGGGRVQIESVGTRLRATTGGGSIRAVIAGALKGDCEVLTSGGSMDLTVDRTAAFKLDAVTSDGHVDGDRLSITVTKGGPGQDELAGDVNGGGPLLRLRSGNGSIAVLAR